MENLEALAAYQRKMRIEEKANSIGYAIGLTIGWILTAAITYGSIRDSNDPYAGFVLGAAIGSLVSFPMGAFVGAVTSGVSFNILNRRSSF